VEILLLFEQGEWIFVTGFTASNDSLSHFIKVISKIKINHLVIVLGLQVKEGKRKRRIKNSDSLYRTITPTYTRKQIKKCRLCNNYGTFTFFCLIVSHDTMCFILFSTAFVWNIFYSDICLTCRIWNVSRNTNRIAHSTHYSCPINQKLNRPTNLGRTSPLLENQFNSSGVLIRG
jgi:hypothetical protein